VTPDVLASNSFTMEWPPNSGTEQAFPELDRAAYFDLATAAEKIVDGQRPLLDRLRDAVVGDS
jgi:predicted NUDIX family NTP pyrophosphohydrolase